MAVGLTPGEERPFVLKCDRELPEGDEGKSVFQLKTLPATVRAVLVDHSRVYEQDADDIKARASGGDEVLTMRARSLEGTTAKDACIAGLAGWSNFRDRHGVEIPFNTQDRKVHGVRIKSAPTDDTINRLTFDQMQELGDAILDNNTLQVDDRKNSPSPPA